VRSATLHAASMATVLIASLGILIAKFIRGRRVRWSGAGLRSFALFCVLALPLALTAIHGCARGQPWRQLLLVVSGAALVLPFSSRYLRWPLMAVYLALLLVLSHHYVQLVHSVDYVGVEHPLPGEGLARPLPHSWLTGLYEVYLPEEPDDELLHR
jgi:hypothetical protein